MSEDVETISADLAIETVERLRKRGGIGRAIGTVFAAFGACIFGTLTLEPRCRMASGSRHSASSAR